MSRDRRRSRRVPQDCISVEGLEIRILPATVFGTDGRDNPLDGTNDADSIFARSGDDLVRGFRGSDTIFGERGNDVLIGGRGNDRLFGDAADGRDGRGMDRLVGGPGNDELFAGPGNDQLEGGDGNDLLVGGDDDDMLMGGLGNDTFRFGVQPNTEDTISDFQQGADQILLFNGLSLSRTVVWNDRLEFDTGSRVRTNINEASLNSSDFGANGALFSASATMNDESLGFGSTFNLTPGGPIARNSATVSATLRYTNTGLTAIDFSTGGVSQSIDSAYTVAGAPANGRLLPGESLSYLIQLSTHRNGTFRGTFTFSSSLAGGGQMALSRAPHEVSFVGQVFTPPPPSPGIVSGSTFHDLNGNAVSDSEPPIQGVRVFVDANINGRFDSGERSTVSDVNGAYTFSLAPGSYQIAQEVPAGFEQTLPSSPGGRSVTVTSGQTTADVDFGSRDVVAPVGAITRLDDNPTRANAVRWKFALSEPVSRVDGADFVITRTGTIQNAPTVQVTDAGDDDLTTWELAVEQIAGEGTLGVELSPATTIADPAGNRIDPTLQENEAYTVDRVAPLVSTIVVDDGTGQASMVRSLTVTFDSHVQIRDGAFELTNSAGNQISTLTSLSENAAGSTVATLTFAGVGTAFGSLVNGDYTLRVLADRVSDDAGNQLQSGIDHSQSFHRLFGDIDGSGVIDNVDLSAFQATYRRRSDDDLFDTLFDFNQDGIIDLLDFQQLRISVRR